MKIQTKADIFSTNLKQDFPTSQSEEVLARGAMLQSSLNIQVRSMRLVKNLGVTTQTHN